MTESEEGTCAALVCSGLHNQARHGSRTIRRMQIKSHGQKVYAPFSCGFDKGFKVCLGSSWGGSTGEMACGNRGKRRAGLFIPQGYVIERGCILGGPRGGSCYGNSGGVDTRESWASNLTHTAAWKVSQHISSNSQPHWIMTLQKAQG